MKRGFTLIELMIVLAIIGIIVAIASGYKFTNYCVEDCLKAYPDKTIEKCEYECRWRTYDD